MNYDLSFVNIGIVINKLHNHINILGFKIAFYGMIIGVGMLLGMFIVSKDAKRKGPSPQLYMDFALYAIIISIISARIYYVIFAFDYYRNNLLEVFNIRGGGLAIYGGVIGAMITLYVFSKHRKVSFLSMADTGVLGLITGQMIGRWGNFVNAEAFGGYTNNLFAMQIKLDIVASNMLNENVLSHLVNVNGVNYIQVHPTFLYESVWNLGVLVFMLFYRKYQKFEGEILYIYLGGYGLGRAIIEGMRTDSLMLFNTGIAISQAIAIMCVIFAGVMILYNRRELVKK